MDLYEHINGYSLALEYFPNCFDSHLNLRNSGRLDSKVNRRVNVLREDNDIEYNDLISGANYIKYLSTMKEIFDHIQNVDIKSLYLRYVKTLKQGSKKGDGYNYLFILTILKSPILEMLNSIDKMICNHSKNDKSLNFMNFISKWNQLLEVDYKGYNYINLGTFISELSDVCRDVPNFMEYNSILDSSVAQIRDNPRVLRRKR